MTGSGAAERSLRDRGDGLDAQRSQRMCRVVEEQSVIGKISEERKIE